MVFRLVTLLLLLALSTLGSTLKANATTCEGLFQNGAEVTANGTAAEHVAGTGVISKYGADIEATRQALKSMPRFKTLAPDRASFEGKKLATRIIKRAQNDPAKFWRLFYVALIENESPYSAEFYEAFLSNMFVGSHSLIQPTANRTTMYALFERLLENGFRHAREVEQLNNQSDANFRSPVDFYSKQFWIPVPGNLRAETTLTTFWKKKVATRFVSDDAALREGRNLADHIVKNTTDPKEYFRFYFIVLSQFRIQRPEAFFRGFLGSRFTEEYYKLDSRAQTFVQRGIAEAAALNKISLSVPKDPLQLQKTAPPSAPISGVDLIRGILSAPRNEVSKLVRAIERESKQDPHAFAELLILAIKEQRFHPSTLRYFADSIFRASEQIDFSIADALQIRDAFVKLPSLEEQYKTRLWGTTTASRGAEADLRLHLAELRHVLQNKAGRVQNIRSLQRQSSNLQDFIRGKTNTPLDDNNAEYIQARLHFIVLTEGTDLNALIDFEPLRRSYQKLYSKLDLAQRDLLNLPVEKTPEAKPTFITTRELKASFSEKNDLSLKAVLDHLQKKQFHTERDRELILLGQELAFTLERLAEGQPQNLLRLVATTIKLISRPLHPTVHTAFRFEMMNIAQRTNMSLSQQEFMHRLLRASHDEAREMLLNTDAIEGL